MVHKFKKYSKKFMCILSAGMFFVMAVFYPLENFSASENTVEGYPITRNVFWQVNMDNGNYMNNGLRQMLTPYNIAPNTPYGTYIYYDVLGYSEVMFSTSKDVYAYKVYATIDSMGIDVYRYVQRAYLALGYYSDILHGKGLYLCSGSTGAYSDYTWLVTNYADNQEVHLSMIYEFLTLYNTSVMDTYSGVYADYNIRFVYTPYTVNDLTDEIYNVLVNIFNTDQLMLSKLNHIYSSLDDVETKLQNLYTVANTQLSYLQEIESNTDELESLLRVCNNALSDIKVELEEQTTWLEKIWNSIQEFLGLQGDDSVEEMPDQEMDNMLEVEGELLGDASADDLENDLNVSIDVDSGSFVWDLIDRLITSNTVVFGGFISVLSLGIVALILGR